MKKMLALLLFVLMLIGSVSVAAATDTSYNYKISTEFYASDSNGDWSPVTSVAAGSDVKMRVSISTNFASGPATLMLAYDKAVLSASGLSSTTSATMALNEDFEFTKKIQQVSGADGTNAANKQLGLGNITQEQFEAYGFLAFSIRTNGCIVYDGSDWIFELDMTVLKGIRGETLECFVIPETVCTTENTQGFVAFPYAESTSASLAELASAYLWYENTPELESVQVTVTPSPTERTVTWVADGVEKVEYYEIGDAITGEWIPEKNGYTFIGWSPEVPATMPEENLVLTAKWTVDKYNVSFGANGGNFSNSAEEVTVSLDYDSEITAPAEPEKQGYIFAGWSESADGAVLDTLGYVEGDKEFYAVWIAASGIPYTVETYTMGINGEYAPVTENFEGTTGETVIADYTVSEGFVLNEEKSVLSGNVAADGSLVLKVYIDRNTYTFKTVVDGVENSADYFYGAETDKPAMPSKAGYTFTGWDKEIPDTMPAADITVTAMWQVNSYDAVFDANGGSFAIGSENISVSVNFDSEITAPETPAKEGYVFAGWAEAENGEVIDTLGKMDNINGKKFYAAWILKTDVAYTVETYIMDTNGEYNLTSTGCTGTYGENVTASYVVPEGFSLNEEKSVLSGHIAADGSLVLKIYLDRNTYTFKTVVDGAENSADYLYGATIVKPALPSKAGYSFNGWSAQIPDTMPAHDITVTADFNCITTVKIKNNPGSRTINYGETLRLTAEAANMPDGAKIYWYVDGAKKGEGTTFEVSPNSGSVKVMVKVVDKNGNDCSDTEISDSQNVSVNSGFFQKIISFFKNLFGLNRTVVQIFKAW